MKKNAYTVICAVATLMVCMLLGAIFGSSAITGNTAASCEDNLDKEVHKAVVKLK